MALVDPYSPCPCGSGQKFKWCCHKVEGVAERAQRLYENGQVDAAIDALGEGLRKDSVNPWLLTRKAIYLLTQGKVEPARDALNLVIRKQPKHLGARMLLTRLALETEGPAAGAAEFQQVLGILPIEERNKAASLARVVGAFLSEAGEAAAALKHLMLAQTLAGTADSSSQSAMRMILNDPGVSLWQKNFDVLSAPPEGTSPEASERFAQALALANEGLWSSAASAFDLLAADQVAVAEAERNLGFCRLWMADYSGAAEAFERAIAQLGVTEEAVDLEALRQQIASPRPEELVERVRLSWPLRDREALLKALRDDHSVHEEGEGPIDPDDPDALEATQFGLLDRPALQAARGIRPEQVPRIVGRVLVAAETVLLETYDDGRLENLADRLTALAGRAIPPAHPRTKSLDKISKTALSLSWEWVLPPGMDEDEIQRLNVEQGAWLIREIWPNTPMPYLQGRAPREAGEAGDAVVPLRAAVLQLEQSLEPWRDSIDFQAFRESLRVPPEPEIDAGTVGLSSFHLSRLSLVPLESLSDENLVSIYRRARAVMIPKVLERSARLLADRPAALAKGKVDPYVVHSDLATLAAGRDRMTEAFDWVRRGRQADSGPARARNAPMWDMLEIRLRTRHDAPEVWVPELAVVMDRYLDDPDANQAIMLNLVEMGLIRMVPNPDDPEDVMVDSRRLQAVLAEYGPRVTTASGQLGVSATKGALWTPGGPTGGGGGGGIWTPGSANPGASGGDTPKIIITGR